MVNEKLDRIKIQSISNSSIIRGDAHMKINEFTKPLSVLIALIAATVLGTSSASAHCDSMEGPVIKAAQKALEAGNVNLVLIWVQKKDEADIKKAFERTLAVRKLSPEAKHMADMYFFETLVRIHRAGEGAPYTGLKPVGSEVEPGIEMADKAVEKESGAELVKDLNETIHKNLHALFMEAKEKKNFKKDDVQAGREYVKAYVTFIHYVEKLYQVAQKPAGEHGEVTKEAGGHQH
jgi:hypothetical protein